ncbi:C-C motif chemokine 4 homolog isoform X2 [Labeo rohita]|uniref:C-C motif chemokine 4 homolog isoform X2 n=1 Tax=Labeo rohita TaxID=84645 RepID=UPI0021E26F75|nr:C-C motif chemokine 4 homolog isoform X2 [Labeo rohita]
MRASTLCLVFGLVLLMTWTSEAAPHAPAVPERCCFNFIGFKIPGNKIVSAEKTGSDCPQAAIVVTTQKGLEFCVKPDEPWIKKVMKAA